MASEWTKQSEPVPGYHLSDDRPFAHGGSGTVWKASGPGGIRVVLKRVPLGCPMGDAERKALELLRSISGHPHLLSIHGFWVQDSELVIASELAAGSLKDRLRECKPQGVPLAELLDHMEDAAKGIDFLNAPIHQFEGKQVAVQHRDVKPDNLLLVGGSVKLSDFGLAKALERQISQHSGGLTPAYAAPECFLQQVSSRSDQYSLAASYVELRTGHPLFAGSVAQVMYGHLHSPPDLAGLSPEETPVVARALAKDPAERFPTCREFVRTLRQAAEGSLRSPSKSTIPLPESREIDRGPETSHPEPGPESGPAKPGVLTEVPAVPCATASPIRTQPSESQESASVRSPWTTGRLPTPQAWWALTALTLAGIVLLLGWWAVVLTRPASTTTARIKKAPDSAHDLALAKRLDLPNRNEAQQPADEGPLRDAGRATTKSEIRTVATELAQADRKTSARRRDPERPSDEKPDADEKPDKTESGKAGPAQASEATEPLARQAVAVLKQYCYRCHGLKHEGAADYNVLERASLLKPRDEDTYVVPGKPDESLLWEKVEEGTMPPKKVKDVTQRPTAEDKAVLKRWILAGAPFPAAASTPPSSSPAKPEVVAFKTEKDILSAIRDHLQKTSSQDRSYQRYFTLTHLANAKLFQKAPASELRLYRAALSKLANSLSWKHAIVVPRVIDPEGTIYNVDLRDLGWDEHELWNEILKAYPYGLKHSLDPDEAVRNLARDVYQLAGSDLPYLRADWFIATASRPPLYHTLLQLPTNASELERLLKVDVEADFLRNKLARAGFATSGVSANNRAVDRHDAAYGAYWKSYDFKSNEGTSNLFQFPLGPVFPDNPFPNQAFEHAGGEVIFNLPNGLQGYLLINAKGERIDKGPTEIVNDSLKTTGTVDVVNGISCMACHQFGTKRFADTLREGNAVGGEARAKVEQLVPRQDAMDRLLKTDEERFLRAVEEATGPFLKVDENRAKKIRDFSEEPIGTVAQLYVRDLGPEEVAFELGITDPKQLQAIIATYAKLRQLGLGPLVRGGAIKRDAWESRKDFTSPFQETARELELGTPKVVF